MYYPNAIHEFHELARKKVPGQLGITIEKKKYGRCMIGLTRGVLERGFKQL